MEQKEGNGWRIAKDFSRGDFSILIGGEGWATELNEYEWKILVPLVNELIDQYKIQESQLMEEETIVLEMERKPWWASLEVKKEYWDLRLILYGDGCLRRGVEMSWPTNAAKAITSEMRTMWDSC